MAVKRTHASVKIGDNSSLACQPQRKDVKMSIKRSVNCGAVTMVRSAMHALLVACLCHGVPR